MLLLRVVAAVVVVVVVLVRSLERVAFFRVARRVLLNAAVNLAALDDRRRMGRANGRGRR